MKKRRIKVLRVVIGLNQGGVQQGVLNLFRGLDPNQFEPIACAIENTGAIGKEIEEAGFEVIVLGYKRQAWKTIWALSRLLREKQIDIVHASSHHPSLYARIAAMIARTPVILAYEHVIYHNKRLQRTLLNKILEPYTDGFTAVGKAVADQVREWYKYPTQKVHITHNGVDTTRFEPPLSKSEAKIKVDLDPNKPVIGIVSRLDIEKGHKYFFDAISKLSHKYDLQYIVVGIGRETEEVYQQAKASQVFEKIKFLGLRRDIPDLLAAFDVFVFPTLREGFPNILLEAMSAGCSVVTSDFSGNLEVAVNDKNALIVPMKDSSNLTIAIEKLLNNPEYAKELGQQARTDILEGFSLQAYANKMASLYKTLCKQKGITCE